MAMEQGETFPLSENETGVACAGKFRPNKLRTKGQMQRDGTISYQFRKENLNIQKWKSLKKKTVYERNSEK